MDLLSYRTHRFVLEASNITEHQDRLSEQYNLHRCVSTIEALYQTITCNPEKYGSQKLCGISKLNLLKYLLTHVPDLAPVLLVWLFFDFLGFLILLQGFNKGCCCCFVNNCIPVPSFSPSVTMQLNPKTTKHNRGESGRNVPIPNFSKCLSSQSPGICCVPTDLTHNGEKERRRERRGSELKRGAAVPIALPVPDL